MAFNEQIKKVRKIKNMTQIEMSKALGVDTSTYSLYESGKREPNIDKIRKICNILNVSSDFILETKFKVNEISQIFSNNFNIFIKQNDLNIEEIAKETNVNLEVLKNCLDGNGNIDVKDISKIAKYIKVPLETLLLTDEPVDNKNDYNVKAVKAFLNELKNLNKVQAVVMFNEGDSQQIINLTEEQYKSTRDYLDFIRNRNK